MQVQYFAEVKQDGQTQRFDFDPKIESEPNEKWSQEHLDALHERMKEAITGLLDSRPTATLVKWFLADDDGKVIEEGKTL